MKIKILSDINGKSTWLDTFAKSLGQFSTDIEVIDSLELAGITHESKDERHRQFLEFGIDKAAIKLAEESNEKINYIGFSIGGTVIWEAVKLGLHANCIYCVSSTRLRYQQEPLIAPTRLIYGANDAFRPDDIKLSSLSKECFELFENEEHDFYAMEQNVDRISIDFKFWYANNFEKVSRNSVEKFHTILDFIDYLEHVKKVKFKIVGGKLVCTGNIQTIGDYEEEFIHENMDMITLGLASSCEIDNM